MSEESGGLACEEARYYQTIEEVFVSHRGDPLVLSNADWDLARRWRLAGIPLRVVLRGIGDAVDAHAHSWGRKRKIGSLRYCAAEVDLARERWHRALGPRTGEVSHLRDALVSVSRVLRVAGLAGPRSREVARRIADGIEAGLPVWSTEQMDRWLEQGESDLLAALDGEEGSRAGAKALQEAEDGLRPYEGRMPTKILEQIKKDAVARLRLAEHGLPRLSLFHIGEGLAHEAGHP